MKRFIFKIMILFSFFLTSCVSSDPADLPAENRYLDSRYTYMSLRKDDDTGAVLNRFNIDTGEVTVLCPDPLCQHGNDCIFSTVDRFYVFDNILILPFDYHYDDASHEAWWEAVRYDFVTGETKVFLNYGLSGRAMTYFSIVDGCLWGKYLMYESDDPRDKPNDEYRVFRYDIIADELEYTDDFDDIPTFVYDGRYYFFTDVSIYSTDLNGKDRAETDVPALIWTPVQFGLSEMDSGYLYYIGYVPDPDSISRYSVRINLMTGEYSLLELPQFRNVKIHDGFLYYVPVCDEYYLGHDDFQNKDIVNDTGGKLMRIPLAGGEPETVFDLGGDYCLHYGPILDVDGRLIIDYGGFDAHEMYDVTTWYETGGGKIVYDTASGGYTVYPRSWNKPAGFLQEQNIF